MLTQERVRELFDYDVETGNLIRKTNASSRARIGDVAGCEDGRGYLFTGISGKYYKNHRIVWLWHNGYLPEGEIDHINRNKIDNRIENLREASSVCQRRNQNLRKDNKSGVKGVFLVPG